MSCPSGTRNDDLNRVCSGHGRCMSMSELALWSSSNGDATDYKYGNDANDASTWDGQRIHGCQCDTGYTGYDCSLTLCPIGDDPGTYDDHSEVQLLQCVATSGNFTLTFRQATTPVLAYNITALELQTALSSLVSIQNVSVYYIYDGKPPYDVFHLIQPVKLPPEGMPSWATFVDNKLTSFVYNESARRSNSTFCSSDSSQIAILHFTHTHGDLPPVQSTTIYLQDSINSNGELNSGRINIYTDGQTVHSLQSISGTTEVDICNHRGICDYTTGTCSCFDKWTSSDGSRQGQAGMTGDCGYRNDQLYTSFDSIQLE
jgi:hypothetical protein